MRLPVWNGRHVDRKEAATPQAEESARRTRETMQPGRDRLAIQWPEDLVRRLPGGPPRYLVRIDDSLRAIVEADEGQPLAVQDIVRQEALDFMAEAAARTGL